MFKFIKRKKEEQLEEKEKIERNKKLEEIRLKEQEKLKEEERIKNEERIEKEIEKAYREEEERIKNEENLRIEEERIRNEEKLRLEQERTKEEERLKNEELILQNKFREEIDRNYISITFSAINICTMHNFCCELMEKIYGDIDKSIFYKTIIEIYKIMTDVNSIEEFDEILTLEKSQLLVEKIYTTHVCDISDELSMEVGNITIDNKIDNYILNESLYGGTEVFNMLFTQITDSWDDLSNLDFKTLLISWFMFSYAKAFNKLLILLRYKDSFVNNKELYTITRNLYIELKEYNLVNEKLYPMYNEFYFDTFNMALDEVYFNILAGLISKEILFNEIEIEDTLSNIINEIDIINKDNMKYNDVYNIIKKIADIDDSLINNENFIYLYCIIIHMFRKNIQTEDLIDILSKQTTLMNDVESYKNQRRLEIDRKRYLNNSFSLDQDMNRDRSIFDNIVTGADFELYLKDLFCQLGYEVITTKASGDQGADLIISKNGIKKVVQAKFYSSSVGNKAVQEVIGAIKFYKADLGMVITNNYYTKSAIELASVNNIELINGDDLIALRERAFA